VVVAEPVRVRAVVVVAEPVRVRAVVVVAEPVRVRAVGVVEAGRVRARWGVRGRRCGPGASKRGA